GSAIQLSRVIGSTTRDGEPWIYLDDGVDGAFSRVLTDGMEPVVFSLDEVRGSTERLCPTNVAGPTGAAHDVIARRHLLPAVGVG
ncbi:hypothetical protein ACC691_40095, partial [Rhizobium johnstonii]|uniref:hypothetical protein n=1 Tax=Rhizobium johnstonii TaxID=3019933 RepID=UPI003F98A959